MSVAIVDYIVNKVYLPDFISRFTELKKVSGDEHRGMCPIHRGADNDTSLVVRDKVYYCHACRSGGTIVNFVADLEQLPYNIAIERVCEELNIDLSENQQYKTQVSIVDKFTKLATRFAENIDNVQEYLFKERGLTPESIKDFMIGYNGDGGVSIPLRDPHGRIVGITNRNLVKKPKYQNSKNNEMFDKSAFLYNLDRARRKITNSIVITEGYFDAISGDQMGLPTVAYLGSEITREQIQTLKKIIPAKTLTVILCADSDDAGQKSLAKARERFGAVAPQWTVKVMALPEDCKDLNDVLVKQYNHVTACKIESIDIYVLKQKIKDVADIESQYKIVGEYIRTVQNPMTKIDIANYLSSVWLKPKEEILQWFKVADDNHIESILQEFLSVSDCVNEFEEMIQAGEITLGFPSIDASIGGARRGDVVFIGGYSGTKKTMTACEIALHCIIRQQLRVQFFSLEMTGGSLIERMYANVCGLSTKVLQQETKEGKHIEQRAMFEERLSKYFFCIDRNHLTVADIDKRIKIGNSMVFDAPIDVVIIDYLQYISYTGEGYPAWAKMVRDLKALAKENNVVLIVLSQLNREGSQWEKPNLKQLKGGGDIEATGDIILLLWCEAENPKCTLEQRIQLENQTSVTIAKDRRGASARETTLLFNPDTTRIREMI